MKKITLALVAVMLVLGMTQCKKEQPIPTPDPTPDGETVYISMKVEDGGKHIVYPGTGAYVFENNDKIYVGNDGRYVGTLTYANGTFSGSITSPHTNDYLHFYFTGGKAPATAPSAGSTTSFTVDISDQSSNLPILSYGHSHIKYVDGTTAYSCMLENQCGLVKFKPSIATSETVKVSGMKTVATIDFATPGITPTDAVGEVTLKALYDNKWAILLPQDEVENPIVTINGYESTIVSVPPVTPNMYYSTGVQISMYAPPAGAIDALFTINANGDQVYFSRGNLQYIGSASTPYWKFAENQWDYLGTTTGQNSNDQNVDRDLFAWGASGYNHGATSYQPWSFGTIHDYNAYGSEDYNLGDQTGQADWGYNAISNGGNQEGLWRTMSQSEWNYVLHNRATSIRFTAGRIKINNSKSISGLILLPDDWQASYYSLKNINWMYDVDFRVNIITLSDWNNYLEANGAVFLPAAGMRYNTSTTVGSINQYGQYWTSRHSSNNEALDLTFQDYNDDEGRINEYETSYRNYGFSVRLVQDKK